MKQRFIAVALLSFQRVGEGVRRIMGGPQREPFRNGDATSDNTQPSQHGGRRDGGRRESIEGEGKDWIPDFPELYDHQRVCVCGCVCR